MEISKGDKVKFKSEVQQYTVRAANDRYIICTKPFNAINGYLYSIIDLKEKIRAPHDRMFNCYGYDDKDFRAMLIHIMRGTINLSHRRRIALDIERITLLNF